MRLELGTSFHLYGFKDWVVRIPPGPFSFWLMTLEEEINLEFALLCYDRTTMHTAWNIIPSCSVCKRG